MMRRLTATLLAVIVVCVAGGVNAEAPHKAWWKYLKGDWTYEIEGLDIKATATWRIASKGNALVGRFEGEDGTKGIELAGWRENTKTLVISGYGSEGDYWHLELDKLTADTAEGLHHGLLNDGRTFKGVYKGKKVDQNHFEWQFTGTAGDGEELIFTGKYARKTEE